MWLGVERLRLANYVDLYLIHNPRAGRIKEVWALLLRLRQEGLVRAVGVSNFGVGQLEGDFGRFRVVFGLVLRSEGLREANLELPEVNQIEARWGCFWES